MNPGDLLTDILKAIKLSNAKGREQAVRAAQDLLDYLEEGKYPPNMILSDDDRKIVLRLMCNGIINARLDSKLTLGRPGKYRKKAK